MYGVRGVPTGTRKHLHDGSTIYNCTTGADMLDWLSSAFHMYEVSIAQKTAQRLLDSKLLQCVCVPLGKDPSRFTENGIYTLLPREEPDAQPLCPPSTRSSICENATLNRFDFEDGLLNQAVAPPTIRARVSFNSFFEKSTQYTELQNVKDLAHRDIVWIKLKSTGTPEDHGPLPSATSAALDMTILAVEKRKVTKQREAHELYENYKLKFGDNGVGDDKTTLDVEYEPHMGNRSFPSAQDSAKLPLPGIYCLADGDAFGPFARIKVRVITKPNSSGGSGAALATATVMSFTPLR
jgi:hypothetical protein